MYEYFFAIFLAGMSNPGKLLDKLTGKLFFYFGGNLR